MEQVVELMLLLLTRKKIVQPSEYKCDLLNVQVKQTRYVHAYPLPDVGSFLRAGTVSVSRSTEPNELSQN